MDFLPHHLVSLNHICIRSWQGDPFGGRFSIQIMGTIMGTFPEASPRCNFIF